MEKEKTILDYDTVALDEAQDAVIIIDQTLLPGRIELIALHTAQEIWDAIYLLKVRGAQAHRRSGGTGYLSAGKPASRPKILKSFMTNLPNIRNIWILPDPPQSTCPGH